ncbi:right-handed parallel beta-helix repeat-containing protein [uncultured Cellulomonas sp.]|uniref:right-handed parallel beta-helix repeat-containing protein n=1 Tax=uncultured Cellulomonas sp. TaxID=189682 RepID=UPI00260E2290|nr:right-handed parallel beta-helix repeat-containing protein [uncultured Cellulomonas sp.]
MSRRPRWTAVPGATLAVVLAGGLCLATPAAAEEADPDSTATDAVATDSVVQDYPGNVVTEPALVADEEERLSKVRTVASMIRWRGLDVGKPYRLSTGSTYTLVLTKRDEPYGIADLLELGPQTFVREPDGAYLLTENIVVQPGATLELAGAGALTIRLASDAARFVSLVNMGGELITRGTEKAPVTLTSWDRDAGAPDATTDDGRAYVRSIGGRVSLQGSTFSDLGFWSGRTGGVALTGSDLPSTGTLDDFGRDLRDAVDATSTEPEAPPTAEERRAAEDAAEAGTAVEEPPADLGTGIEGLLPAGVLPVPEGGEDDPSYSYVSAEIEDSTFEGNAFGLFVSSANGVDISGSTIQDSLIDGLVMHRFVINAAINDTVSRRNAGDGIILARATTGIMITEVKSLTNGGSGIVVRGNPLADGPNATGMPVGDYGNNSIANSVADDNGRYGIEVVGGENVNVNANDVNGNDMGIVVRDAASDVTLVGNRLADNLRHGIALRDGVTDASVSGNVIAGGPDGVYLRDSAAVVERNTLSGLTHHAITVVGAATGTVVEENTLAGRGPSAVDRKRSEGATVGENDTTSWESTKPFWTMVRNALQPLTVMWLGLALLVLATAVKGSRHRTVRRDPYAPQRKMAEIREEPVVVAPPAGVGASA